MSSSTTRRGLLFHASIAAGLTLGAASQAPAMEPELPPITTGAVVASMARPLAAWAEFCNRTPAECRIDRSEPIVATMTPGTWRLLTMVNVSVNRAIEPMTDMEHFGVVDRWGYPDDGKGDCEDYQLLKRRKLVEAGLPRRALLMTVVIDDAGEGHAVLTVRTDRGDFVLDNKRDAVLPWAATGYTYVKRESQYETAWVAIDAGAAVLATAARR